MFRLNEMKENITAVIAVQLTKVSAYGYKAVYDNRHFVVTISRSLKIQLHASCRYKRI